jgi:hypothetical protein
MNRKKIIWKNKAPYILSYGLCSSLEDLDYFIINNDAELFKAALIILKHIKEYYLADKDDVPSILISEYDDFCNKINEALEQHDGRMAWYLCDCSEPEFYKQDIHIDLVQPIKLDWPLD